MIYAGSPALRRPALRRARRGALPPGRLPRPGVGGGDDPPAAGRGARVPVGHGVERRGAGRLDHHRARARPRPSSRSGARSSSTTSTWSATRAARTSTCCPPSSTAAPTPRPSRLDDEALHVRGAPSRGGRAGAFFTPRRVEVIDRLQDEGMLPAITFIFSRNACDDARDACLDAGLRLTTPDERARIRAIVDERTAALADADLDVLGLRPVPRRARDGRRRAPRRAWCRRSRRRWRRASPRGSPRRCSPPRRSRSGVNMPARSVVIERLTQVHRRAPRAPHPGGVHAAHRAGRPSGHRRGRLRHRALVAVRPLRTGRRAGLEPHLRAARPRSGPPTTWPRTWCAATSPTRPTTCSTCPSPSSRPTRPSCASRRGIERQQDATGPRSEPRPRCERGDVDGVPAACEPRRSSRAPCRADRRSRRRSTARSRRSAG